MERLGEQDHVERPAGVVPVLECGHLDRHPVLSGDLRHPRIWFQCNKFRSARDQLAGRDTGPGPDVEDPDRTRTDQFVEHGLRVPGPVLVI
ncbi:hypothetical protein GCM10009856_39910 [Mycolicibacterium llatzerense]